MARTMKDLNDGRDKVCPYCDLPLLVGREEADPEARDPEADVDLGDEEPHGVDLDENYTPDDTKMDTDPSWAYACRQGCGFWGMGFPSREAMYEAIDRRLNQMRA